MKTIAAIIIAISVLTLLIFFVIYLFHLKTKRRFKILPLPENYRAIMLEQVDFYRNLNPEKQKEFEQRVQLFLARTHITGVKTTVEDLDRLLIASSAVIPIFGFPGWEYVNLNEVLLYPDHFSHDFQQMGNGRDILGMVGDGAMNRVMILSKDELRNSFANKESKTNVGIHEFVHLVDKTDGAVDGIPEVILQRQYIVPWLELIQREIQNILTDQSDINPYGATNKAEMFAVVSEYFFERPDLLQEKHPELYELLVKIFRQRPV